MPETFDPARPIKRSGVINSAAYCNGVRVADVPVPDLGDAWRHSDRFLWVGLYEPDEKLLHLPLAREGVEHARRRGALVGKPVTTGCGLWGR